MMLYQLRKRLAEFDCSNEGLVSREVLGKVNLCVAYASSIIRGIPSELQTVNNGDD